MDINEFKSVIEHFDKNLEYYKNSKNSYNEDSCRLEYIDKLLSFLGWDVNNGKNTPPQYREVIVEKYDDNSSRPDYTLTIRGVTKLFIEAKKPSVDILNSIDSIMQCRKYGWNANHNFSVLTNFEYLLIYDTGIVPVDDDNVNIGLFRKFHFSEYIENKEQIFKLLSKESVYEGGLDKFHSERLIENERLAMKVDDHFLRKMNSWRVKISNELYLKDKIKYCDLEFLNDSVQRFINKLVFLRICEDRNLAEYHKLKVISQNTNDVIVKLNELFLEADMRYNSGLFTNNEITFDLENACIMSVIEDLYYPKSPYLFNIIEPNILGRIYEMFLTESLIIDKGRVVLTKKKDFINRSIVTTPIEVVKFMVENSLKRLFENRTPAEILLMKFADISCGSGIFLEELYDYVSETFVNWYLKNDVSVLEYSDGGQLKLPIDIKKSIIVNCIYGIDIDLQAVEVTKFSLLVKLLEGETRATVESHIPLLPVIDMNIQCGNSLIDYSMIDDYKYNHYDLYEIVPFDWNSIAKGRQFDLIIGNPPYVKTEDMHNLLNDIEFKMYKDIYKSAYKQFDKYFIFVEKAINNLNTNGVLSFLIPNKFMKVSSGIKLREILTEKKQFVEIVDFGDSQLFKNKTIYSSILVYQKTQNNELLFKTVDSFTSLLNNEFTFQIRKKIDTIDNKIWSFIADKYLSNISDEIVPLTNFVDIYNGIQTSAERPPVYWFTNEEVYREDNSKYYICKNNKKYNIEKEITKNYFKPTKKSEKGLNSYSELLTNKRIIFPYNEDGSLILINNFKKMYPGAYEYLFDHFDILVPKQIKTYNGVRDVPGATKDTWYQYGRTQGITSLINTRKIIVGILSKEPMYIIDENDMIISSGGTAGYCAIKLKKTCPYDLEYIQAWLTSSVTEKVIREYGSPFEGGFVSRGTAVLKRVGIYPLDFTNKIEKSSHDTIVRKSKEINKINDLMNQDNRLKIKVLKERKRKLLVDIDSEIGRIYLKRGII
jgi:type I restriction-modification system DNA methylase subunit